MRDVCHRDCYWFRFSLYKNFKWTSNTKYWSIYRNRQ